MEIIFDVTSAEPIVTLEIDFLDGEPAKVVYFPAFGPDGRVGSDGRYFRGLRVKPTRTGQWPVVVRASDVTGRIGQARCEPGVTVTER